MIGFVSGQYGESGLITLAVVVSLIEFSVVLDGVGMAMQPLIGTYFGEKNHRLIKRVMKAALKAAIVEGLVATLLICIFAKQFCGLFGISGGEALEPSMHAIRIVSIGFAFCSAVSLMTSYYMLIDRIRMATCFACLQNGLLYILLPILGSTLFGTNGMWAGFVIAPVLTLVISLLFVYLRMSISGALYAPPFLLTCLIFYERIIFFLVFTISIKSIYLMKIKSIFFQVIINGNLRGIIPKHAAIFFI